MGVLFARVSGVFTDDVKPGRHIPEGVDPQSWMGFEERIGRRRFAALAEAIQTAAGAGDFVQAQALLEEAREIRPDAPELLELELQVFAIAPSRFDLRMWTRIAGGVVLLIAGVSMMIGTESVRRLQEAPELPAVSPATFAGLLSPLARPATPALDESPLALATVPDTTTEAPAAAPERIDSAPAGAEALAVRSAEPGRPVPGSPARPLPGRDERPTVESGIAAVADAAPAAVADGATAAAAPSAATIDAVAPAVVEPPRAAGPSNIVEPRREEPAARVASAPAATAPPTASPKPVVPPIANDEKHVADVLQRYVTAYGELDARAAREVWPSVDERALARAFDGLVSQRLSFDACQIDVQGVTANAICQGQARYVGKVGSGEPRTEPRAWRFELRRDGEAWKIATAEARRPTS